MSKPNVTDPNQEIANDQLMGLEPTEVMSMFRRGEINRRDMMKLFAAIGITSAGMKMIGPDGASAATELNAIVWEGYTDESFAAKFEEENDAQINTTFMATSDDAFAQLQAGGGANFDVITASNDLTQRLVDAKLVQEIDSTKLTNFPDLYEQFQRPEYITFDDKLYGANFAWGPTILAYDGNVITTAPDSWAALLDEQYEGKIAAWNYPIQIAQYALLLDPKPEDPFTLTDEQLAQVKDMLIKQRPLVRKYWDFAAEVADLFVNGEIVIADPPPYGVITANTQGANVIQVIPKEGATGWSDSWMITTGAKNIDLCYKWMDYMIGPDGQMGVLTHNNYSITNQKVIEGLDPELRKSLLMEDVAAAYDQIYMWKNVTNLDVWTQIWQEATSG